MMVKFSSVIQHNIVAPKFMLNRLIYNQNHTYTAEWGWVAGLMMNKTNLSKAEVAAGCC